MTIKWIKIPKNHKSSDKIFHNISNIIFRNISKYFKQAQIEMAEWISLYRSLERNIYI